MKNRSVLLGMMILLQSCYSYKNVNFPQKDLIAGKKYKIRVEDLTTKAVFQTSNDSTTTFTINKKEVKFATNKIKSAKVRKFSLGKTLGFASGVILVTTTIVILDGISNMNVYSEK